jgi:hypothetical protein
MNQKFEPCEKRQKVVKRSEGREIHRCLSKDSGVTGKEVTPDICHNCPVRVFAKKGCKDQKPEPVKPQEIANTDKEEVESMMEDAGMVKDIEEDTPPDYPPMTMQLFNYKEALLRWQRAGRPTRSSEEIKEIHENICKPCSWYDKEQKRCRGCGCKVTKGGMAVTNKIKMATEHCPRGLW